MSIRTFLIIVIVTLFTFADIESVKISGRVGSGGRVSGERSTFWQTGSSSRKIGWNLPLSSYYKGSVSRTSIANPTSLSEFDFRTSRTNTQSRYPSMNNSPYSSSGGYPSQARDPYHDGGNVRYLPLNIKHSYPNYDDYDDTRHTI